MGMTFEQLSHSFAAHCGISDGIDGAVLAIWLNEAQLDLALDMGNIVEHTFAEVTTAGAELPADCLRVLSADSEYWFLAGRRIAFAAEGSHTIRYRQNPPLFDAVDNLQISELDPALHFLLPLFAVSRYWDMESEGDGEESNHANKWLAYYRQGRAAMLSRLDCGGDIVNRWQLE